MKEPQNQYLRPGERLNEGSEPQSGENGGPSENSVLIPDLATDPNLQTQDVGGATADKTTVFLTYLAFSGDVPKTATALGVAPKLVENWATREKWIEKVRALNELKRRDGQEALARELNRTINYVQAVRLRTMLDRVLRMTMGDQASFEAFLFTEGKMGRRFSCKAPLDLVKALETVHNMTYKALSDSAIGDKVMSMSDVTGAVSNALEKATSGVEDDDIRELRKQLMEANPQD